MAQYSKKQRAAIPMKDGQRPGPVPNLDGLTVRPRGECFEAGGVPYDDGQPWSKHDDE